MRVCISSPILPLPRLSGNEAIIRNEVTLLLRPGVSHALMVEQRALVGLKGVYVYVEVEGKTPKPSVWAN